MELKTYDLSLFKDRAEQSEHHKVGTILSVHAITKMFVNLVFPLFIPLTFYALYILVNRQLWQTLKHYCFGLQLAEAVSTMTAELETEIGEIAKKEEQHKECVDVVAALELSIKNYGRDREDRLLALEKEIKSLKKELASVSKEFKVLQYGTRRICVPWHLFVTYRSEFMSDWASVYEQNKLL